MISNLKLFIQQACIAMTIATSIFSCNVSEVEGDDARPEPTKEEQSALESGIEIDSITIREAFYKSEGHGLIKASISEEDSNKYMPVLFVTFHSLSRDLTLEYYRRMNEYYMEKGIAADYVLLYSDTLKEIHLDQASFEGSRESSESSLPELTFMPTPSLESEATFAEYPTAKTEFIENESKFLPEHFIVYSTNDVPIKSGDHRFRFVFEDKEFAVLVPE